MSVAASQQSRALLASIWGSYRPEGTRDLRYDFLRGFAVLAMVVDHVGGPSWLYAITGGNRFYTSAAEGFIFLSGLLVGIVYGRIVQRDGLAVGMRKALERAVVLYLLTVGVTFPLLLVSEMLDLPWATGVFLTDPVALVVGILTLHRTYYLIDVMVLYTLLLAVAPFALYLLLQGRTRLLLGLSWALWLAFQIAPDQADVPWPIAGNYLFHFSAWQVFFFTAMALGYHRDRVARWFPPARQRLLLVLSGLGFAGLLVLYRLGDGVWQWMAIKNPALMDPSDLLVLVFGKGDVRPGRVVASVIVFGFLFLLTTVAWRPLYRALGWLLLPLGQNALYAYTAHIVIIVLLAIAFLPLGSVDRQVRALNTLLQVVTILLIWVLIRYRVLFPSPAHRTRWALVPAVLGILALVVMPFDPSPTQPGWEAPAAQAAASGRRAANAFGTPIPRGAGAQPPPGYTAAQPLPAPRHAASTRPSGTNALPEYVGPIRGRFLDQAFYSRALNREMGYFLYLPPDYDEAGRSYPVLYLLHGASGSAEEWPAYGIVDALDRAITAHDVEPFIMVLPEGDFGYWINHADNGERWGDYLTTDLVTHIDTTYRTLRRPYRRAVGGLSMGGSGALVQAFTHPDVFGIVGADSPSLRENNEVVPILGEGAEFAARDPVSLAATAPGLDRVQIWLDIGEDDPWYPRVVELDDVLTACGIDHEFHVWPGDHDGEYWTSHIPDYLRFYSHALTNR
ncbi:MAG TPA: OpgC domain-containing protein [Chloroflexota bacterium]|nr:OpgC domain-containing protein [Chloroflexota bacterium]